MKDKQTRAAILQWLIPILVLLFVIIFMVLDFSSKIKKTTNRDIENSLIEAAEAYAKEIFYDIQSMEKVGLPMAQMLCEIEYDNPSLRDFAIKTLEEHTPAYLVAVTDKEGKGIGSDGKNITISDRVLLTKGIGGDTTYTYLPFEPLGERAAIVSSIPLMRKGELEGYIFLFYPTERLQEFFQQMEYNSQGIYLVVTEDGTIIENAGAKSRFRDEPNFIDVLQKSEIYEDSFANAKRKLAKISSGVIGASYQGEAKKFVYVPIKVNKWHLVMGISQSHIDTLQQQKLRMTESIIWKILIALFFFFILVMVMNVINKLRFNEKNKTLENKADTDLLTDLNNKIATERKIKKYMAENPNKQALMMILDVDNFKKINDTMGHAFGDEVLRALGLGLHAEFRVSDILGRTGGDEFTIFLKDLKEEEMISKEANHITRFFKEFKAGEYVKYSATASIGAAVFPKDGKTFEELYKAADKALYDAKKRGKNQIAFYKKGECPIIEAEHADMQAEFVATKGE